MSSPTQGTVYSYDVAVKPVSLMFVLALLVGVCTLACKGERRSSDTATATPVEVASSEQSASRPEGGAQQPTVGSTGCDADRYPGGSSLETFTFEDVLRSYWVYVPESYTGRAPVPLVLNFHGLGSTGKFEETYAHLPDEADKSGFIAVSPDALNNEWSLTGGGGVISGDDDFAFIRALVSRLEDQLCIDPRRVYATGISNGGAFVSLLGCELDDVLAAIAPVAGEPFAPDRCEGKQPVPIVIFHGTADQFVPFDAPSPDILTNGALADVAAWAAHNGCEEPAVVEPVTDDVTRESYSCTDGAETILYVIEGGGHTWPGAEDADAYGRTTHTIDATGLIWEFFAAHPKS